ncbi:MAG: glycine cleavage system aminomethyltransferase GcvT [Candidatus Marisimplicoccus sp.]
MKKTLLYNKHSQLGAKISDFAGFQMPISYSSVNKEHLHVRNSIGIFDVSHMGEIFISGKNSENLLQRICSNDISKLNPGMAQYNCITNFEGGIIDDLIVYKIELDKYLLVVNASNIQKDYNWILTQNNKFNAAISDESNNYSLLAIQGPNAIDYCQNFTDFDLNAMKNFSHSISTFANCNDILLSKTGYTGSGGLEIYIPNKYVVDIWDSLFKLNKNETLKPIGLAARDTLRIEMGYCLYGNDINDNTSPIEAGLGWITKPETECIGYEIFNNQINNGIKKKLVGFKLKNRGIPRAGYKIYDSIDKEIGITTSGTFSPILKKGIGLGYINFKSLETGKDIHIKIRDEFIELEIIKPPFIEI